MNYSPKRKTRVVVTGANGFIGKNLISHLERLQHVEVIEVDRSFIQNPRFENILSTLKSSDVVFHLAGVNRAIEDQEFIAGNTDLTARICNILEKNKAAPTIIYSSSIQVTLDNTYGRSKLLAEQRLMELERKTDANVYIYRLPNVFGKWSRPNTNSAIATFCYNTANDLPISIHHADAPLNLLYIDDLCERWLRHLSGDATESDKNQLAQIPPTYSTTVGEVADQIRRIRNSRESNIAEPVGTGLARALHATYLSFLSPDQFSYPLKTHGDQRGNFAEFIKTKASGQVSVFTANPGETRGGHYHHSKTEKFLVVHGQALFRFRNIISGENHSITVDALEFKVIETVPGWAHDLKNVGKEQLVCVLWANECFDPEKPDTHMSPTTND